MAEVKVKWGCADRLRAVKGEWWVLTNGPEQPNGQPWRLTPGTRTREDVVEWTMLSVWSRTGETRVWSWRTRTRCGTHDGVWWFGPQNHP
jgi:hypothetical protein